MPLFVARSFHSVGLSLRICEPPRRCCSNATRSRYEGDDISLLAAYLMDSAELTKSSATKAANKLSSTKLAIPSPIVALWKEQAFSDTQISKVFRSRPILLCCKPETIAPKIEFLTSKFIYSSIVALIISSCPFILASSLENRLLWRNTLVSLWLNFEKSINPRASVVKFLLSKGLRVKLLCLRAIFLDSERHFVDNFILRYEEAPLLLTLYKEKLNCECS